MILCQMLMWMYTVRQVYYYNYFLMLKWIPEFLIFNKKYLTTCRYIPYEICQLYTKTWAQTHLNHVPILFLKILTISCSKFVYFIYTTKNLGSKSWNKNFFFFETGFLCAALAVLELRNPPASASQVLGLKAWVTTAQSGRRNLRKANSCTYPHEN
jgi:hypothetical protein